jgi:hypothetical protein
LPVAAVFPVLAVAIKFQSMILKLKAVLGRHFLLESFNVLALELNNLVALVADEVVVVLFVRHIVIDGFGVAEVSLLADADFAEKIQGPIDGGESEVDVLAGESLVKLLGRDVVGLEKLLKDQLTLVGEFEIVFGQMDSKQLFFSLHLSLSLILILILNINEPAGFVKSLFRSCPHVLVSRIGSI